MAARRWESWFLHHAWQLAAATSTMASYDNEPSLVGIISDADDFCNLFTGVFGDDLLTEVTRTLLLRQQNIFLGRLAWWNLSLQGTEKFLRTNK
jgi:hypothetical protein